MEVVSFSQIIGRLAGAVLDERDQVGRGQAGDQVSVIGEHKIRDRIEQLPATVTNARAWEQMLG